MIQLLITRLIPLSVLLAIAILLFQRSAPVQSLRFARSLGPKIWPLLGFLMVGVYGLGLVFRLLYPAAIDAVESNVMDISALAFRGQPIYTAIDSPERYSLLYGPLCYLPYAAFLRFFGSSMESLQWALLASNVLLLLVLWILFRRRLNRLETFVAVGFVVSALMMKGMATFMMRGDTWLAMGTAVALIASDVRRRAVAILLFALACTLIVDVKFTGVFYVLLPLYFLWRRHGWFAVFTSGVAATVLSVLPFLIPYISARNYLAWLKEASHHPLSTKLFAANCVAALILAAPVVLFAIALRIANKAHFEEVVARHRVAIGLFAVSITGSLLTGSKVGAGRTHLNSTFIVAAWLAVLLWKHLRLNDRAVSFLQIATASYCVFLVVPSVLQLVDLYHICAARRQYARSVQHDLQSLHSLTANGTIEIGYVNNAGPSDPINSLSLFEPQLALRGEPVLVEAGALFDMGLSKLPIPDSTVEALHACTIGIWLLPKDGHPFEQTNIYAYDAPARFPDPLLFSEKFREEFLRDYKEIGQTDYFDVWACTPLKNDRGKLPEQ